MNDIIFWLDSQIAYAIKQQKELDEMERYDESQYWLGREQALRDVKNKLEE